MFHTAKTFFKVASRLVFISLLTIGLFSPISYANNDLLDVDAAFKLDTPVLKGNNIIIHWTIAEGYHLYKDKMSVVSSNLTLAPAIYSKAEFIDDPLFGKTESYARLATISVAYTPIKLAQTTGEITVKYQGCIDKIGVCYPPQTRTLTIKLPQEITVDLASPVTEGFSALVTLNNLFTRNSGQPALLEADQAFPFTHHITPQGQLELVWDIAHDYHLYKDKFKIKLIDGDATLDNLQLPKAETIDDPLFGKTGVYHGLIKSILPITYINGTAQIQIEFQGCSISAGVCYPPIKRLISIDADRLQIATANTNTTSTLNNTIDASQNTVDLSESDQIADTLKNSSLWIIIGTFFIFGLLLAFTPCVFPMIPILSSIIVGQGDKLTTQRAFIMSLVYVLAMSVTYTIAGILAGVSGDNLQAAFQNPWIIGSFSGIFLLLSLSMFGFFELQLPSKLQTKLTNLSNSQQGGTLIGVAIMGLLSALIVGPCVAPPLAGALIYIGQTGDAILGGVALFAMSMGMGLPLLLLGTSAGKLLPHAGVWMVNIKAIFGVILIGIAIWMLERIIAVEITMISWALLFIIYSIYMGALESTKGKIGWLKLMKGFALVLLIYGMMILIGLMGGSKNMFQPLKIFQGGTSTNQEQSGHLNFKSIKSIADLEAQLGKGKPVMLDFYADWCISCKEMELLTFSNVKVHQALTGVTLLQADVTKNDAVDKALMKKFRLIGPPAILFFNPQGIEQKAQRVIGFKTASAFTNNIHKAFLNQQTLSKK